MSNIYTQIHLQFIFAVKYRTGIIRNSWKEDLNKYITGIVQQKNHRMITINGVQDHIHILVGMRPTQSISDLLKDIKAGSSRWINDNKLVQGKFEWQEGYGAFSYSRDELEDVIYYIKNQEVHHQKVSFREEYIGLLQKFKIEYDEKYIFRDLI
jgi:putative transposase